MKILFISRDKNGKINPLISNQANSLKKAGITVDHFIINGKGVKGYIKSIFKLHKLKKNSNYNAFHAHYSLSGFVGSFAKCKPLVVSLMGSDIYYSNIMRFIGLFFIRFSWNATIVKSHHMAKKLKSSKVIILPNGVDMTKYAPVDIQKAFEVSNLDKNFFNILFIANPSIKEKNYSVAKKAVDLLDTKYNAKLIIVSKVDNDLIPYYMSAGNLLLLPSLWEGSPNVVKEALACNLPIIATAVGDIPLLISNLEGCYICENNPIDISKKIELVIKNKMRIQGRNKLNDLQLNEEIIALKLIELYKKYQN